MSALDAFIAKAQSAKKKIVLPEGHDPRVLKAASIIAEKGIAEVVVLGSESEISESCKKASVSATGFSTMDHCKSDLRESFCRELCEIRAKKGMTMEKAAEYMSNRLFFGAMMVRKGNSDGMVAGSIASTPDMLRAAFTVIGTAPGLKIGSSCFIMDLKTPAPNGEQTLLYADCGVNPNPNAEELSDIAIATASTYRALMGKQPKIAFLSFSTFGSAQHESLQKVVEATRITSRRISELKLDVLLEKSEVQADAAIVPSVAVKKCADSVLKGQANILIFPDLNAGNICYKITERLAGAAAYGPILQGLAKPLNDLSRGCSAEDIVGVAAITACQAMAI